MTKIAFLASALFALVACQGMNNASSFDNATPVEQIAEPTDGVATD